MNKLPSNEKPRNLLTRLNPLSWGRKKTASAQRVSKQEFDDDRTGALLTWRETVAGERVTEADAMKQSVVFSCRRFITGNLGQLPHRAYRRISEDSAIVDFSHPASMVLGKRPNPEMGPMQFKEVLGGHALISGNGYAEIVRNRRGAVIQLWPIHPTRMEPERFAGALKYVYTDQNYQERLLEPDEVFHIRGFGNGIKGVNVIEHAAETIGWARATEIFGSAFFGNGIHMNGALEIPNELDMSPDAVKELKKEFASRRAGNARKGFIPAILDKGMKWVQFEGKNNEAQFIETLTFQINQIARYFGVPPHKVNELSRATFTNIIEQSIEVIQDTIMPWVVRFEEEANYKLLPATDEFYTKINVNALMRGDPKSRAEFYRVMVMIGAMSPNDVRRLEEFNPYEGGDVYVMQSQMVPVKLLGMIPRGPAAPSAPAEPEDEKEQE